jgi:drug/metabolite transporter (DMT)-like permease
MSFERLRAADWIALAAALALIVVMALDWYSTEQGREARRIERFSEPSGAQGGEVERQVQERAREAAEEREKNAWQADAAIDRVILLVLLATFVLAVVTAFVRAASSRSGSPASWSGLTALAATVAAALVAYRMVQEPGFDAGSTVEVGAPLALIALGVLALASAMALRSEEAKES